MKKTRKEKFPDAVRQEEMYYAAVRKEANVCRAFLEIQDSGNPLTPEQIRILIDKRPELYYILEAWASKPS